MSLISNLVAAFAQIGNDVGWIVKTSTSTYATRAEASSSTIPAPVVSLSVEGLLYRRDPNGTALTTTGSDKWSPLGDCYPEHWGAKGDNSTNDYGAFQAALDFTDTLYLKGGKNYVIHGELIVRPRLQLLGPGAANADTTRVTGAPKLIFRGSGRACFWADTTALFNHAKFQGFSLRCEGDFGSMFRFGRCVQVSLVDISATCTGLSTNGIYANKAVETDHAWLNQIDRCNIILPNGSNGRPLNQDWTDSIIQASSLSGGAGCLEESHGNKWLMNNIERSSDAGIRLRKVTTNCSSLFLGNLFDANGGSGVTIDVSGDTTSGRNIGHIFIGNKFRTVSPVNGAPGACDIAFQNPGTETYTAGILVIGNHHGVAAVPQYGGALSKFEGLVTAFDSHFSPGSGLFTPDADQRTYIGRNGLNIPGGLAMVRGSRQVYGMDNVSGFFGANSGAGSGVWLGSVAGASPSIGASRDRNGVATDLRFYTNNTERVRIAADGTTFRPSTDGAMLLGTPSFRWSQVYAATGTISTSDARAKQDVRPLSEKEKAVAQRIKGSLAGYRMKEAAERKGDGARWHFGAVAQDVAAAFYDEGLDPHDYGMFCYDEWEETPPLLDEEGNEVEPAIPAGDRYGLRYDELVCFVLAAL